MKINADFDKRVLVHSETLDWIPSPMAGVSRRPLDRVGGEVARATSIVRYDPGSKFPPHVHGGGEEFIVLDGVFQDEHGDFPAGSYVRNPPTSRHTPASAPGCVIFVKLWQFDPEDRTAVTLDINALQGPDARLHKDAREEVSVRTCAPGAEIAIDTPGGAELLVLEGAMTESGDALEKHSWLRTPVGGAIRGAAGPDGVRFWLKTGHLAGVEAELERVAGASSGITA
ncbi:MAG: cupin domain-containing protein [Pseudomonadota bacterium]